MPDRSPTNQALLWAHFVPYGGYVASLSTADWHGRSAAYGLALVGATAACVFFRRQYRPLRGPAAPVHSALIGAAVGLVGCGVWLASLAPFVPASGPAWSPAEALLRALAATLVVPFFEEQLMRSYVLGLVTQWQRVRASGSADAWGDTLERRSILELEPGACTAWAAVVSTGLFALGHAPAEWLGACLYGAGMAGLYAWRRDLLSCVVAHATTNAALAAFVLTTGSWRFW